LDGEDDDPRRERQLGPEAGEQGGERRDDLEQDDRDDDGGDRDDGDRVDQGGADLGAQLDRLLDVGREALQDGVEDTARLAGGDHVHVEIVEGLGVPPHGVGQRRARLDVLAHLQEDLREALVLLLVREDLEALHQRQSGVDHDGELAGEDRERLGRHPAPDLGEGDLLAALADAGDDDVLAAQGREGDLLGVGREHALLDEPGPVAPLPDVIRHRLPSCRPWPPRSGR
jgi:hypothetical protein